MDTLAGPERLRPMTNEPVQSRVERGARIELYRRLVDISQRDLADKVAMSRVTVAKAIAGDASVQEKNLLKIETFLEDLLEEVGIDPGEPEQGPAAKAPVTFRVTAADGTELTISGPPEEADMMREQIMKVIHDFKGKRA